MPTYVTKAAFDAEVKARIAGDGTVPVVPHSGDYTLVAADAGRVILMQGGRVLVPTNVLPVGAFVTVVCGTGGQVPVLGAGSQIQPAPPVLTAPWSHVTILQVAPNVWIV